MKSAGVLPDPAVRTTKQTGMVPCDEATGMAGEYACKNIDMMGFVSLYDLGTDPDNAGRFGGASDIWGWTDPMTGNEYAIIASIPLPA